MNRYYAYKVLYEVLKNNHHAHLVLKDLDLSPQDQSFVSALVYTILQNKLFLEYQTADLIDEKVPLEIRIILLMGMAQYFKMDSVPDYAMVNESVELSKKFYKARYSKLVNAVLKKVIARKERILPQDELQQASIAMSMPLWILKLLNAQYGLDFALGYARYCQQVKANYLRVNTFKTCVIDETYFIEDRDMKMATAVLFQSDLLEKGCVLIQDINSQKVVPFLDLKENLNVLDCCCGPGTKTTQIANLMNNTGKIVGVELHESRSQTTRDLLARWGVINTEIVCSDLLKYQSDEKFDRILLDAPCSGLGVLSHKHDLRYHILPSDLDDLQNLQKEMLDHVSTMLEVSGILVYATCTLNKKENEQQIKAFLNRHDNYELLHEETTNPMETLGDGFYIAKLVRKC